MRQVVEVCMTTVQLLFESDTIPAHIKLGLTLHPVHPYAPRLLQCHQCHRIGHMPGCCLNAGCCPKYSGERAKKNCTYIYIYTALHLQKERQACKLKESNRMTFSDGLKESFPHSKFIYHSLFRGKSLIVC